MLVIVDILCVQVFDLKTMGGMMDGYEVYDTAKKVEVLL